MDKISAVKATITIFIIIYNKIMQQGNITGTLCSSLSPFESQNKSFVIKQYKNM